MSEEQVNLEALQQMQSALSTFISDASETVNQMQSDCNDCADLMNGDAISAKMIVESNHVLGSYRELISFASEMQNNIRKYIDDLDVILDF